MLPEYCFSGSLNLDAFPAYVQQLSYFNLEEEFARLSSDYPATTFVFGSAPLRRSEGFKNLTPVIKDGKQLAEYSKKALIYNENYLYKSTNEYPVFTVGGWRVGVAICWDIILPEVFRNYTGKADLVIVPSLWGLGGNALQREYKISLEKKYYKELCIARAYENAFNMLFVNAVGRYTSPHYSDTMMGGSIAVCPPEGVTLLTRDKDPEKLHIFNLDMAPLQRYREYYATDRDYEYYKSKSIF